MKAVRPRRAGRATLLLAAVVLVLAACDGVLGGGVRGRAEAGAGDLRRPPPVTVRAGDRAVQLEAWTWCFANGCADGAPPADPPNMGAAPAVEVEFPLADWSFEAEFAPVGAACPRRQSVPLDAIGEGAFTLNPAGPAGVYDVTLFGRGDGDLFVTFRWTTPADGQMPEPSARLAVLADHDGTVDSYGVELELSGLAATRQEATAQVTVTSAGGGAVSFDATRAAGCIADGTVYWDGPAEAGLEAAALGSGPFRYDVVVTLDGERYSASAVWPRDEIVGNEPSVALEFAPPLPALR